MSKINSNLIQEALNNLHSIITDEIDSKVEEVYSTMEVKTNKVYVDSNNVKHPIYRKMAITNYVASSNANIIYIDNLNFITSCQLYLDRTGVRYANLNSWYGGNDDKGIVYVDKINEYIKFDCVYGGTLYMTVEYTKTTD